MTDHTAVSPWYADGLRFDCTRCGACCSGAPGYVWVSVDELAAIAAMLELSTQEFDRRHVRRIAGRRSLLERPGGDCEFLERFDDGATGCRIHPVRPAQCRTWPFWKSNLTTQESWEATRDDCPGINRGPVHPLPAIQQALKACRGLPL